MAHTYYPKIRMTPPAGAKLTYDLTGYEWVTVHTVTDEPLYEEMELLDRSVAQTRHGFRRSAALAFQFETSSSSETELAEQIITFAMNDDWTVELSMDNGTTYREVVLSSFSRTPLSDKNIGVEIVTVWTCVDMLDTLQGIGSGDW